MFGIDAAGAHEIERIRNALGQHVVAVVGGGILHETQHPFVGVGEAGVTTVRERADEVQGGGRLTVGHVLTVRVRHARGFGEGDVVDDVAAVGGQRHAVNRLVVGRARFGELPGDAPDLHHRHGASIGQHNGHLQEQTEEIADVVGAVLAKALGAIAALKQEGFASRDLRELLLEGARLARKNERRIARQTPFDLGEGLRVRIGGHLQDRLVPPAFGRPTLAHDMSGPCGQGRSLN